MKREKAQMLFIILFITFVSVTAGIALGDDHGEGREGRNRWKGRLDVAPVDNPLYKKECGSCHFAYQPGFLPARSWEKMMGNLANHFGDNAELDPEDQKAITDYLLANAADGMQYKASAKIMRSLGEQYAPQRISETPYFIREHREIPGNLVANNPQVKSLSHCGRCHTNADTGSFNEHDVIIPGYGRFED